ncbi:MAG: hypothetical protein CMF29_04090 [Kiritimatiellaceae bacterium]|nr:hypothetical protein [Kiritimatiellaceae bacterium]
MSQLPFGMPTTGRYDPMSMGNMPISDMRYRGTVMPYPSPYPSPYPRRPPMGPGKGGRRRRFPGYGNPLMGPQGQLAPVYGGGMGQVIPTNIPFRDPGYGAPVRSQNLIQALSGPNSMIDPNRSMYTLNMMDRFRQRPDYGMPYPMPSPSPYPDMPTFPGDPSIPGGPGFPPRTGPGKGKRPPRTGPGKGGRRPYPGGGFPGGPGFPIDEYPNIPTSPGFPDVPPEQVEDTSQPAEDIPPPEAPQEITTADQWAAQAAPGSYTRDTYSEALYGVPSRGFLVKKPDGTLAIAQTEEEAQAMIGTSATQEQQPVTNFGTSAGGYNYTQEDFTRFLTQGGVDANKNMRIDPEEKSQYDTLLRYRTPIYDRESKGGTQATIGNPFDMARSDASTEDLRNVLIDDGSGQKGRININFDELTEEQGNALKQIAADYPDADERAKAAYEYLKDTFGFRPMAKGGLASLSRGGVVPLVQGGIASLGRRS